MTAIHLTLVGSIFALGGLLTDSVPTTDRASSGAVGVYGIIERVVFEPNDSAPQRVQLWGAFAYVDGGITARGTTISKAVRGYMYFTLPSPGDPGVANKQHDVIRTEWNDLKSVAGTGQAVGFGAWIYIGVFDGLRPDSSPSGPPYILSTFPGGGSQVDMRVRPATEAPATPANYQTNTGVVKLPASGSHAAVVAILKQALARG